MIHTNNVSPTAPTRRGSSISYRVPLQLSLQCECPYQRPSQYASSDLISFLVLRCSQSILETFSDKTRSPTMGNQRRKRQPKPDIHRTRAPPKPFSSFWPSPALTRKALATRVVALAVGLILWFRGCQNGLGHYTSRPVDWNGRRDEVKEAFISSWDAYSEHAWG